MTSRERVRAAIRHEQPDLLPLDVGSTLVTGIRASAYARLKRALGIGGGVTRVYDPFQMLAEVEDTVKEALGVDTYGLQLPTTVFGYRNEHWKPFRMFDGTDVEISGHFAYGVLPNGDIVQYPRGDRSAPPSGRMPKDGYHFDAIVRQDPIDESKLDAHADERLLLRLPYPLPAWGRSYSPSPRSCGCSSAWTAGCSAR